MLCHPDEYWLDFFRKDPEERPWDNEEELLKFIKHRRETHPYFVKPIPGQRGEFLTKSSGACYEEAKRICMLTNSYIATDLPTRWKEIELDHQHATGQTETWSPFAKAIQNADLKVLNNIPVQSAFQLRQERRLEHMRNFFNRIWRACREADPFSKTNAVNLAAELDEHISQADGEWQKIDRKLLKWLGVTGSALISSGIVGFIPAASAAIVTGATGLTLAQWQRKSFKNRFPAGFFLGIRR